MKKIIQIIALILSFIYVCKTISAPVELRKVFHHTSEQKNLNIGKLVFYFDTAPKVQVKKIKRTEFVYEYVFEFQDAEIKNQDVKEAIDGINTTRYAYDIQIKTEKNAHNTLLVSLTFDERDIGFTSQEFIAITGDNAIAINFYNKILLQQLEEKEHVPVLQTTWDKNIPTICIDSGHGGRDFGAIGLNGVMEKDICLALAKQVGDELTKNGLPIVYTRESDVFVSLESRIKSAADVGAGLFVSIHANATTNRSVSGLETYCCNPFFLRNNITTLDDSILQRVTKMQQECFKNSLSFAQEVHAAVCQTCKKYNQYFFDRKVKHGAAQVLFASNIPSLLIEVGFISHPGEELLLASEEYQRYLAESIAYGITKNIEILKYT